MKSLISKTLLIAALVLSGNAAMAATAHAHKTPAHISRARSAVHVAARSRYPRGQVRYRYAQHDLNVGQFIQSFFGEWPANDGQFARYAGRTRTYRGSSGVSESPSFDYSTTSSSATDAQVASDAESAAIQQMNDTNALNASMAAAEQQNEAANAATLQTEINAGM